MHKTKTGELQQGDFLFTTLYLTPKEYEQHENDLKSLAEQEKVDFIVVLRRGTIEFEHYTYPDNLSIIEESQELIASAHIGDLGQGVYAIYSSKYEQHIKGIDNLYTFFENYEEDEIGKVLGTFHGKYGECVYGYQHEGYVILMEGRFEDLSTEVLSTEKFLLGF